MNGQIYLPLLTERRHQVQAVTGQIKKLTRKQLL